MYLRTNGDPSAEVRVAPLHRGRSLRGCSRKRFEPPGSPRPTKSSHLSSKHGGKIKKERMGRDAAAPGTEQRAVRPFISERSNRRISGSKRGTEK